MGKVVGNYRFDANFTTVDTSTKTWVGPKVLAGKIVELTHASVADYTTASKNLILGYRDSAGSDHYVVIENGASIKTAQLQGRIYLLSGESPIALVESPTASDVLYCSFHGIVYEMT